MGRNRAIDATLTLPGIPRPVGRPRKPDALTNAQRQRKFRQAAALRRLAAELETSFQPLLTSSGLFNSKDKKRARVSVTRNGNCEAAEGGFEGCSASTTATNSPSGEFPTVFTPATDSGNPEFSGHLTPATDSHQWEKSGAI